MLFTGGGSRATQQTPSTRGGNPQESRGQGGGESGRGRTEPQRPVPSAGTFPTLQSFLRKMRSLPPAPQGPPAPSARPSPTPQGTPTPGAAPAGVGTQGGGGGKPRPSRAEGVTAPEGTPGSGVEAFGWASAVKDVVPTFPGVVGKAIWELLFNGGISKAFRYPTTPTPGGPVPTPTPPATTQYKFMIPPPSMPVVRPDFGGGVVPELPTPVIPKTGGVTAPYFINVPLPPQVTYTPPYPAAGLASPAVNVVINPPYPSATTGTKAGVRPSLAPQGTPTPSARPSPTPQGTPTPGATAATDTAAPQTAVPNTTAVAPPRTTAGVAAPPAGTPRSVDELTDYYARKLPGTGAEFVNWREVDSMWPGTFEEFDAWVDAFTREHGYPPWSGSFHPTEVLRENVAARDWGIRFMMRHGRPPTEEEYKSEWYANRFGLGPYDYDNPAFFGAPLGAGWGRFWARRWGPRGWGEPWNRRGRGGRRRRSEQPGGGGYEVITLPISGPGMGV